MSKSAVLERYPHPKFPRLVIQLRSDSSLYQGVTFLDGRQCQKSLKTKHLPTAFKLAEDWYQMLLRASAQAARAHPLDKASQNPTVADVFAAYRLTLTPARREYADMRWGPIQGFWRVVRVADVTAKTFREFYRWRRTHSKVGNHTLHKDKIAIRQILKHAVEEEHIDALPMTPSVGSIPRNPRPWLSPTQWQHLVQVATKRIIAATGNRKLRQQRQDLLDFMEFMVASMCRVDEVQALRFGDCRVVVNEMQVKVLVLQVTGKRGSRTVVAQPKAAVIWKRRHAEQEDSALIFPERRDQGFMALLQTAELYTDAAGFSRNFKSLRATAISFRLLEPHPNLLVIARNAGTSLAMIDQFYAKRLSAEMHLDELSAPSTVVNLQGGRPSEWNNDGPDDSD